MREVKAINPAWFSPMTWLGLAILAAVLLGPGWIWFFWRIEPGPDQLAVLVRKVGRDLPSGQIMADAPDQKGIQMEVLPEGRYFRNPYVWGWRIAPITDVPPGKVGVLVRLYGRDLEAGQIIAGPDTKGIVAEVLRPGKYRINPYAYNVRFFDATAIRAGYVGVVTSQEGRDPLNAELPSAELNVFLVQDGMKGVQPAVLDPGTYYLNPYLFNVVEVNLQSQRFEMSGEDAISFLTLDGFTVNVEGTLEFAIMRDSAALLTHRVGDMEDVVKKVILPRARGFSRLEGSKNPAIDYIVGETRQKFQNVLQQHLQEQCQEWGVAIKSVLIRNILPPDQIASIIRDRQVAVQNALKYEQQIEQARSKAELTRQEMLAEQNKEKVVAETARIQAVIEAEQNQAVRVVAAQKDLEVAQLENAAAAFQAEARLRGARAERDVIGLQNKAQADVYAEQVRAFGTGLNFARYTLYRKIAPRIDSLLAADNPDGLGGIFTPLLPASDKEGRQ